MENFIGSTISFLFILIFFNQIVCRFLLIIFSVDKETYYICNFLFLFKTIIELLVYMIMQVKFVDDIFYVNVFTSIMLSIYFVVIIIRFFLINNN